jgi:predicted ABC-type ATPase
VGTPDGSSENRVAHVRTRRHREFGLMPNVFIIAGPNGAGKTTYARRFLAEELQLVEFLNADTVAAGLSAFAPEKAAFAAGRFMLRHMGALIQERRSFSFETTLSGRTLAALLRPMRVAGYRVRLDFLWVRDVSISEERVRQRVAKGGHDIPGAVQRRRFHLGIRNLFELYRPLLDHWRLFDNSDCDPLLVAEEEDGALFVRDAARLASIERMANIAVMPGPSRDTVEEPWALTPEEETRCAVRALRKAFADAVLENLRFGLPVIQWRDGRVVEVPAEELAPLARRILAANGEPLPKEGSATVDSPPVGQTG